MENYIDVEHPQTPTINYLNDHIGDIKKNLEDIKEFYKESYSILESYRDKFYKFAKDKNKREIWKKYCERQTAGFLEAKKPKKKKGLPHISKCSGNVVEEEKYKNRNGKVYLIIQKNQEEVEIDKLNKTFGTHKSHMEHLNRMAIIYAFSIYESYIKELLHLFYRHYPERMNSPKKSISYIDLTKLKSIVELHYMMAHNETNKLGRCNIDEFSKILNKKFNIEIKDFPEWQNLRKNYYRRNLIVHNGDFVDENYSKLFKVDDETLEELSYDYVIDVFKNIKSLMTFLEKEFIKEFDLKDN